MVKKPQIAITGITGFVGNYLNQHLKVLGYQTKDLDLRKTPNPSPNLLQDTVVHLAGKAHDLKKFSDEQSYFEVNTGLTKKVFDAFLDSQASVFVYVSSIKVVADLTNGQQVSESMQPQPDTPYGKSKLAAETYLLSQAIPNTKKIFILRPCMIYGPGNKGNLNSLYKLASKGIPWPLGVFNNQRSFCSIENLMFIIKEIIERQDIPPGIYNVADDEPISTNELIGLIAQSQNRSPKIWNVSKKFIEGIAWIGDRFHLPLNTERLQKLTSSYVVSNAKIKAVIGKPLPVSSREGLIKTFKSFNNL